MSRAFPGQDGDAPKDPAELGAGVPPAYQSTFSFADNELENVLNLLDPREPQFVLQHDQHFQVGHMPMPLQQLGGFAKQAGAGLQAFGGDATTHQFLDAQMQNTAMLQSQLQQHMVQGQLPGAGDPAAMAKTVFVEGRVKGNGVSSRGGNIPRQFLPKRLSEKPTVSHSAAEKQRRDRINTLIEELRELVPADRDAAEPSYVDDPLKRPKHVVLSDTIKFVRLVLPKYKQEREAEAAAAAAAGPQSSGAPGTKTAPGMPPPIDPATASVAAKLVKKEEGVARQEKFAERGRLSSDSSIDSEDTNGSYELEINVSTKQSKDSAKETYAVNVLGKDRNGLLHDITRALRTLELEISHAVIQTEASGRVNDIFECDKSNCSLTPEQLKNELTSTLLMMPEMKRKRTFEN